MKYFCCESRRLSAVREAGGALNGIEFLEVLDDEAAPFEDRQRFLDLHLIRPVPPGALSAENVRIEGGDRIRNIEIGAAWRRDIEVVAVSLMAAGASPPAPASPPDASDVVRVEVSRAGDFSTYTLRLVRAPDTDEPPDTFDPILAAIDFSFKVACRSDLDCRAERDCPPTAVDERPEFSYLAKDYASFRELMLDRLAVLAPDWRERNAADLGMTLVEILAYVGDYLSYRQDAVVTEGLLGTARRRPSIRRLARMVDWHIHDGSNARAWVHLHVRDDVDGLALPREVDGEPTRFLTRVPQAPTVLHPDTSALGSALASGPQVFESLEDVTLRADHNVLFFHTWGGRDCCLPEGATKASLRGAFPSLRPGDVLVLVEVRGAETGLPADADPGRRHAVRLTSVRTTSDPVGGRFMVPPRDGAVPVTDIAWHPDDALPFPLCVSSRVGAQPIDDVSVALGNIVLVDHGRTVAEGNGPEADVERRWTVPEPNPALTKVAPGSATHCAERKLEVTPPRFRPRLSRGPVTQKAGYHPANRPASAAAAFRWRREDVVPVVRLEERASGRPWSPVRDLLDSGPSDPHFVVETENDGTAVLRFGDGDFGDRPNPGTGLRARYRIGNGAEGNVGADAIAHVVTGAPEFADITVVEVVRNPLPATGGVEPESIERVRQEAPHAFRIQERAVTAADYAELARRCDPTVQHAVATFRWTGSWTTAFVTADRVGGRAVEPEFAEALRGCLERYRMAGQDLKVDGPVYVPLEVELVVCIHPDYPTEPVRGELQRLFSGRAFADGRRGIFHPDNFTFGQTVFLSPLYEAALGVDGVDSAEITKFQRRDAPGTAGLARGRLDFARLEIPRLDNDPNHPDRGVFDLIVRGGR